MKHLCVILVCVGIVSAWAPPAAGADQPSAPLYLVKDGQPEAEIVYEEVQSDDPKMQQRIQGRIRGCANELARYIRQMTGATMNVVPKDRAGTGAAVEVGRTAFVNGLKVPWDELDKDTIVIKRVGNKLVLAGASPTAVRYAVNTFLEDVCGVRWYKPDDLWTIVPERKDIVVNQLDLVETPDYISRSFSLHVVHAERSGWLGHNKVCWGARYHVPHNMGKIVDPSLYEEHPEYFPQIGGKRVKPKRQLSDWQPCFSKPAVVDLAVEAARKYFDENPDRELFSLAQNDNLGWCQCPKCLAMNRGMRYDDHARPDFSPVYFTFVNRVAAEVAKSHPDKKFGAMAYELGTKTPPPFKLHPNVVIKVVNDRSRFHGDPKFRAAEQRFLRDWAEKCNAFGFHNWHWGNRYVIPRLELQSTRDFLRFGREVGAVGYHGEEYPNWGLDGPKTWITARLLWDTEEDVDALVDDYCRNCYGEAADPMRRFYDTLEGAWNHQPDLNLPALGLYLWREDRRQFGIVTPAVVDKCNRYLERALKLTDSDQVRQRLAQVRRTFRMVECYTNREALYNSIKVDERLIPVRFAEMMNKLDRMARDTKELRAYIGENIRGDLLTYHGAWPGFIPMDPYYCELGGELAKLLAERAAKKLKDPSAEAFARGLQTGFTELAKPVNKGQDAWSEFSKRVEDYLGATTCVPRIRQKPAIDGKVGKNEWAEAPALGNYRVFHKKKTLDQSPEHPTTLHLGYDDDYLYVVQLCREDLNNLVQVSEKRDGNVWRDDSVDLSILPAGVAKGSFCHYIINPRGTLYDAKAKDFNWSSQAKIATGKAGDGRTWIVEAAIPWSDFGRKPVPGDCWRAQFARIDIQGIGEELSCWAPTSAGFNNADYMGVLLFGK